MVTNQIQFLLLQIEYWEKVEWWQKGEEILLEMEEQQNEMSEQESEEDIWALIPEQKQMQGHTYMVELDLLQGGLNSKLLKYLI